MLRLLLKCASLIVIASPVMAGGPETVQRISGVSISIEKSNPPNLLIEANGLVPTTGYSDVRLLRVHYIVPPADGIQDYMLVATPPDEAAAQVITEVSASNTFLDFNQTAPWLEGVRIHGTSSGVQTRHLSSNLRIRKNINRLTAQELKSLEDGISAMKSRPPSDRKGWQFQANIHGETIAQSDALWNQCRHGSIHFLTWHRAYLLEFENILREASGDDNLTLPYWDWSTERSLPVAFRDPSSPLFDGTRSLNGGALIPSSIVVDDLWSSLNEQEFDPFSSFFEGSPHGAVHVQIGGNMARVPTAANDPIFWLHHCNIDRVWDSWLALGGSRENPSDPGFQDEVFSLPTTTGNVIQHRVGDLLNSNALGYRYEDLSENTSPTLRLSPSFEMMVGHEAEMKPELLASSSPPSAQEAVAAMPPKKLTLESQRVELKLANNAQPILQEAASEASSDSSKRLFVTIVGLSAKAAPRHTYAVYLNLPEGDVDPEVLKLHKIQTLNLFGIADAHSHQAEHGDNHNHEASPEADTHGTDIRMDATRTIERLRKGGLWNDAALTVTLHPIKPIPVGEDSERIQELVEMSAREAELEYQRIDLSLERISH